MKKRKKYRTGVCSLIIVFCCFLSACQNKGTENIKTLSESLNYKMEYYYFPEVSAAWKIKYFFGNFYVAGKNKDMNTIIGKVNEQGELLEEIVLELNRDIEDFCLKEDGSISCLMPRRTKDRSSFAYKMDYVRFDGHGKEAFHVTLQFPEKDYVITGSFHGILLKEQKIAVLVDNELFLFNETGEILKQCDVDAMSVSIMQDLYDNICIAFCDSFGNGVLKQLNAQSGKITKEYETGVLLQGQIKIIPAKEDDDYDFILINEKGIYGYSTEKKETAQLLEWLEWDIVLKTGSFLDAIYLGDGSYAVLLNMWEKGSCILSISKQKEIRDNGRKTELVLGTFPGFLKDDIRQSIVFWNQQQEEYKITIREYQGTDALALEIAAGRGPDLFFPVNFEEPWISYAKKGYFADFYDLMEQYPKGLKKEDFLDNIREIYEMETGKLYFLPFSFSTQILAISKEDLGNRKRWTLDEMEEILRRKPAGTSLFREGFAFSDLGAFFRKLCYHSFDDYYDPVNGMKIESVKKLINFTEQWSKMQKQSAPFLLYAEWENNIVPSGVNWVLKEIEDLYGKNGYALIGYPCEEGTGISVSKLYNNTFGIVADGKNVEAAWDFVQSFYSYDAQMYDIAPFVNAEHPYTKGQYFPVRKDAFNDIFQKIQEENIPREERAAKESFAMLKEYLKNADRAVNENGDEIQDMIGKGIQSYFNGEKEQKEMLNIVENQVNLYTKERQ